MSFFTQLQRKLVCVGLLSLVGSLATQAQTPFTCKNGVSYVTRNANTTATTLPYTLYENNVATAVQTSLGAVRVGSTNVRVNAIGYNEADNFLYGSESGTSNILKIGSNGLATRIAVPGLPALTYLAGDVAGGFLYLNAGSVPNDQFYKINLTTLAVETFTLSPSNTYAFDDLVVSATGKLYAVTSTDRSYLLAITLTSGATPATGTASLSLQDQGLVRVFASNTSFNLFTDASGYIYAQGANTTTTGSRAFISTYVLDPDPALPYPVKYVTPEDRDYSTGRMYNTDGASCKTSTAYTLNQPGFSCQPNTAYEINSPWLHRVTLTGSGSAQLIHEWRNVAAGNNLGFNPKDGYLYMVMGVSASATTAPLAKIRSDYSVEYIIIPNLPAPDSTGGSDNYAAGDFDANGVFYLMDPGNPTYLRKVDLNPYSPTYKTYLGEITPSITFPPPGNSTKVGLADWAYNSIDGNMYGVSQAGSTSQNGMLYRLNPTTGATCSLGLVGAPNAKVAAYFDASGYLFFRIGQTNDPNADGSTIYKIRTPVHSIPCGNTSTSLSGATVFYNTTIELWGSGDGARCFTVPLGTTLSGNIWNDGDASRTVNGSESTATPATLPAGETLTVYVVNASGVIIRKADVGSDGKWTMPDVPTGSYSLMLSNDATKNMTFPATGLSTTLPADWNNTGYNFGGTTGSGATGSVTVGTTAISNLNFGINKKPVVSDVTAENQPNPGGSTLSPVTFSNPANGYNGSDVEDGTYPATLTGKTVTLTPGTGGDLYYNGVKITTPTAIPNFDPTKVSVDPTDALAATTVTFTYAVADAAGIKSDPKTVTVPFAANPLPVTLISFTVRSEGSSAHLYWSTATEENNTGFDIQRSVDLRSWNTVGFVKTQNGTSKTRLDYHFTDATPRTGTNYYRLRQIDTDGKTSESPVRSVVIEKGMKGLSAYPNPVKDQLTVNGLTGNERIQILDLTGRIVTDVTNTSNADTQMLNLRTLSEGLYILNIRATDGSVISKKLIKTK